MGTGIKSNVKTILYTFIIFSIFLVSSACSEQESQITPNSIPVIYSTDLFHPHDDPDDHFDLMALYAIEEFDIRAIILDQGLKQDERPGNVPIQQLNTLTKRSVPLAKGLAYPLKNPQDKATDQPRSYQSGVDLLLDTLEKSSQKVTIITVGSLRDVAAAYNRKPELFHKNISRIYSFIGEASLQSFQEYNVSLDVAAFITIMNSKLPVYWVPCFDGGLWKNNGKASYWQTQQGKLLKGTNPWVHNFFYYALFGKNEPAPNFAQFQHLLSEEMRRQLYVEDRNLWCTAVFTHASGRKIVSQNNKWVSLPMGKDTTWVKSNIFTFKPIMLWVDEEGIVRYEKTLMSRIVHRFSVVDRENYSLAMTSITNDLFVNLSP